MYNKLIKNIGLKFLILLLSVRLFMPVAVLAQVAPTDTPTPDPTVSQTNVNNAASNTNNTTSSANTGSNTTVVDTPTPTPSDTPTDTPTPTPDPNATLPTVTPTGEPPSITVDPNATSSSDITASNDATITNNVDTTGNTGANTTSTNDSANPSDTPTPTPTPQITVQTGDAVSVVAGSNTLNTTSINSDVTDQTINIFGDQTGNIDLSTLFQLVNNIITNDNTNDPVINVQVTGVNNYAYLANNVVSSANTGNNTTSGSGDVVVNTGNAESVVSLINKVNLTVVNSSLHIVTINIFGHLTGNIILPNLSPLQSSSCSMCGVSFNANNQAVVNNTIGSTANTGNNNTTASDSANVTTGNAASETNTINMVNENILGAIFENLFLNEFGVWNGSFIGWDGFAPQGSGTFALNNTSGIPGGSGSSNISSTSIQNTAYVNNNISSLANTGGNSTNGQNTNVTTGSAYSAVSLINLINSNFFKSLGFFGFINIFGQWDGSIGGADKFVTPTPTPTQDNTTSNSSSQQPGGQLSVQNSNNVGAYVLPGDTITFFIDTQNIGTGPVDGTTLHLFLMKGGENVGGTTINLGDIKSSGKVKVTTGLVLSKDTPPGDYLARAVVSGTAGDGSTVSATADSAFVVGGSILGNVNISTPQTPSTPIHKAILGASTNHNSNSDQALYFVLLGVLVAYFFVRVLRAKDQFVLLFTQKGSFKSRLNTLRLFLL